MSEQANSKERLSEALRDMQLHWVRFYRTLPDGEYEGLGEMRQASIHAGKALVGEDYGEPDGSNQQAMGVLAQPSPRAGEVTDAEIFRLACKLVDTAAKDRETYWVPALSELCKAVLKQDAETKAALAAATAERTPPQVCEKQYHLYVWSLSSRWVAVAQAETVAKAREILLEEIGSSGDGSCPVREAAAKFVKESGPGIWHRSGAEFELTNSANLEECDDECDKLRARIKELEADRQPASAKPDAGAKGKQ